MTTRGLRPDCAGAASGAQPAVGDQPLLERAQTYLRRRLLRLPVDGVLIAAWQDFYARCGECIRRFAIALGVRPCDVEELEQEVWAVVLLRLPIWRYDPVRGQFRTWLYQVVRNKVADHVRRRARHPLKRLPAESSHTAELRSFEPDPAAECESRSEHETLQRLLVTLRGQVSALSYRVFHLRRLEERSVADVAALLGLTAGQVRARQCRTERRLLELSRGLSDGRHFLRNAQRGSASH